MDAVGEAQPASVIAADVPAPVMAGVTGVTPDRAMGSSPPIAPRSADAALTADGETPANASSLNRAVPVLDTGKSAVVEARPKPRGYELIGTTLSPGGDSAVLRDPASEEHWTVRAGDRIEDASVAEIRADRVVLTSAQGMELLLLAKRSSPAVVSLPAASTTASAALDPTPPATMAAAPPESVNPEIPDAFPPTGPIAVPAPAMNPAAIPQSPAPAGETPTYTESVEELRPTAH